MKKKDYHLLIPIISNINSVYLSTKNYDQCFQFSKEALKYLDKINDVNYKPAILCDLAVCYEKKSNRKETI